MTKTSVKISHIGTATVVLGVAGVKFLTDPFFSPAVTKWDLGFAVVGNSDTPAIAIHDLPVIDAILLSHEDHADNLDEPGRTLLNGRRVFTCMDGARKLHPRPGVQGLQPWEKVSVDISGKRFQITGTPCVHLPGGEVTGFILTTPELGESNGLPNAIYFSGDTVYVKKLTQMRHKFQISVAILSIGATTVQLPGSEPLKVTMCGKEASQLFREIGADILVPMHCESWGHFLKKGNKLREAFKEEGIADKVQWLEPGALTVFDI
ncbi:unnamed protein product [Fusarium equiseti]|uniref:Metallo-beta-lactamase domain-containing protein n=1 Tax=Fusarium equiseti TaxID=61235 RepID=A0A8J2IMJ0_FUSEQ|nr:unnamed protein product [Fusarium equiseti]